MKKYAIICVLLISAFGLLSAEDTPHRKSWEIGSDLGVGLANNMLGLSDILNKEQKIVLDLNKLTTDLGDKDAMLGIDLFGDAFLNLTIKERYFLSFYVGVDGGLNLGLGKSIMEFVSRGNIDNHSLNGDIINISGGVFAEMGAGFSTRLPILADKLKVGGSLAYYIPLFYIPKGSISYDLDMETGIKIGAAADFKVFSPISGAFTGEEINVGDIFGAGGVDFSLQAEYLLPLSAVNLALGLNFTHIPLVPATMKNGFGVSLDELEIDISDPMSAFTGGGFMEEITDKLSNIAPKLGAFSGASQTALRPMKMDIYADYRPFIKFPDLLLVRPNIGFTAVYPDPDEAHFNIGVLVKTSLVKNIFNIYMAMGVDGGVCKNRIGLGLNFRAAEFLLEVSGKSQNFEKSFSSGFGLTVGTRFGW
ncbi:hypothetical protein FACS189442_0650 [Spirochaetia bacterium]|nr:hypothetical protein FACS189442_0650 [Spirochaetia bacterium]